jgi:ABC-type antimicrobial peptide transport system permease subunit
MSFELCGVSFGLGIIVGMVLGMIVVGLWKDPYG